MNNSDAEKALLSSCWLTGDEDMIGLLDEKDFVDPFNQWLLKKLQILLTRGWPLDMMGLQELAGEPGWLDGSGVRDAAEAKADIAAVLLTAPTTMHKHFYLQLIRRDRVRRGISKILHRAQGKLAAGTEPAAILSYLVSQADRLNKLLPGKAKDRTPCQQSIAPSPKKAAAAVEKS